jgi:CheY-like chemotaxis protein
MIELFNGLLDLSKFETGAVDIHRTVVAVQTLLDRLDSDFRPVAHAKGLEVRMAPSAAVLWTDTLLLERILRNLVSNAVRYTEAGGVLIGCRRRGTGVRIDVLDTGLGIPQEQLSRIFEEFHQLNNPARTRQGGSGLGLAIVKRAADLLGHPIEVASLFGRGSRFSITVPLAPPEEVLLIRTAAAETHLVPGGGLAVLVVEDDPLVTVAMRLALEEFGCTVMTAATKEEALAVLSALPDPPRLVIADYRLPDGDGIALIEEVRRRGSAPIRTCLVSGDLDPRLPAHFRSPDECFLQKPIQAEDLRKLVDAAHADTWRGGHGGGSVRSRARSRAEA